MPYKYSGLRQKPPLGSQIDWSLPITRGLRLFCPFNQNAGGLITNLVNNDVAEFNDNILPTAATDYVWGQDNGGTYCKNGAASPTDINMHCFKFPNTANYTPTVHLSIFVLAKYSSQANQRAMAQALNSSNYAWAIYSNGSGNWGLWFVTGGGFNQHFLFPASVGGVELVGYTYDGTAQIGYVNGVATGSNVFTEAPSAGGGKVCITGWDQPLLTPYPYNEPIYAAYIWDRALSASEVRDLNADPYHLVYAPKQYLFGASLITPLTQSAADQIGTMLDSASNSGYQYQALFRSDYMQMLDAVAIFGGDPDFQRSFGDNLNYLADALTPLAPAVLKNFSDSLNNLADSATLTFGIPKQAFDDLNNWNDSLQKMLAGVLTQTPADTLNAWLDAVSVNALNVPFLIAVADTMNNLNDAIRFWNILRISASDNMVLSDSLRARFNTLMRLSETLSTFLENVGIKINSEPTFGDQLVLSDAVTFTMAGEVTRSAADTLLMTDSVSLAVTGTYNPAALIDRIRRYLSDMNNA